MIKQDMTTTAFEIEGHKITKNLGMVRGIIVRSRNIFTGIAALIQSLFGGNITLYTHLCERTRKESYDMMIQHAEKLGANAIVGVRYDANNLGGGITEVICYGTAVVVFLKH